MQSKIRQALILLAGIVVGCVLMFLVLRTTDWETVANTAQGVHLPTLGLSVCFGVLAWVCRAWRFQIVVEQDKRGNLWPFFSAVTISEICDILIPLRMGIPARAIMLKHLLGIPFMQGAARTILDRVMDFLAVAAMLLITVAFILPRSEYFQLPAQLVGSEEPIVVPATTVWWATMAIVAMVSTITAGIGCIWLLRSRLGRYSQWLLQRISVRLSEKFETLWRSFSEHLNAFSSPRQALTLLAANLVVWGVTCASMNLLFHAYGLPTPWYTPIATLSCIMLGTIFLPTAPGFVGQYHLAIIVSLGLVMPEAPIAQVSAVAIFMHMKHMILSGTLASVSIATLQITRRRSLHDRRGEKLLSLQEETAKARQAAPPSAP